MSKKIVFGQLQYGKNQFESFAIDRDCDDQIKIIEFLAKCVESNSYPESFTSEDISSIRYTKPDKNSGWSSNTFMVTATNRVWKKAAIALTNSQSLTLSLTLS